MIKKRFIAIAIVGCVSVLIFATCESHEQRADEAFERVKAEKMLNKDTVFIEKKPVEESKSNDVIKKNDIQDEWTVFKAEIERKILANSAKIKEIKGTPNVSSGMLKKATSLEKDNNNLKIQMDEYKADVKLDWEKFKTKINYEGTDIGIKLKAMALDNKAEKLVVKGKN